MLLHLSQKTLQLLSFFDHLFFLARKYFVSKEILFFENCLYLLLHSLELLCFPLVKPNLFWKLFQHFVDKQLESLLLVDASRWLDSVEHTIISFFVGLTEIGENDGDHRSAMFCSIISWEWICQRMESLSQVVNGRLSKPSTLLDHNRLSNASNSFRRIWKSLVQWLMLHHGNIIIT